MLGIAKTLSQHLRLLLIGPIIIGAITATLSYVIPISYTAKASILPPNASSSLTASSIVMGALGGAIGGMAGDLAGLKDPSLRFIAYIRSDSFLNRLINKFELNKHYDQDDMFLVRKILASKLDIVSDKKTGLITILFTDQSKEFAAAFANSVVSELRLFVGALDYQEAKDRQNFLETQINEVSKRPFQDSASQQIVISGLIQQFNNSLLDVDRVGPTFTQIDYASPPEHKSSPKRAVIVIVVTTLFELFFIIYIFITQSFRNALKDPNLCKDIDDISFLWKEFFKSFINIFHPKKIRNK